MKITADRPGFGVALDRARMKPFEWAESRR